MTIDFDKLFEGYVHEWYRANAERFDDPEEAEGLMPDLYEEWADKPCVEIGGVSPRKFFAKITDAEELVKMLVLSSVESSPCALLLDRIEAEPKCAPHLITVVKQSKNPLVIMLAINLLDIIGLQVPYDIYVSWLLDYGTSKCPRHINGEIIELIVEVLSDKTDIIGDLLTPFVEKASYDTKVNLADILAGYKNNETAYNLLVEMFEEGQNLPLYAGYLGKYGDKRAIEVLESRLADCNYLEYIEIAGAIEKLGGEADIQRDFSRDPYYRALKLAQ